ncbi:histidine kinase [Sphaerisporangium rubeum]|uniref:histidine kinase n=1 Tax=Sphaerisporangium rubeum TaxID=321317 RepID=A0A7X0M6V8_9ACTN|nr:histidine kinase [Sphaerisporangium rubeum]MBB6473870.1 signal transduction histidine kinase [Sphaerisporangium rubeum]
MDTTPPVPRDRVRTAFDDTALFLLAVLFGLWIAAMRWDTGALPEPRWLFNLDQLTGVVACAALWLRRRHPVGLSVALVAVSSYSELAGGAMLVTLFTVAVHRPPRVSGAVYGLSLLAALCYSLVRPEPDLSWPLSLLLGVVSQSAVVGWGLFVNHRRRLVESLRERALRAEAEARLRAEQAQHLAREAIAREIHDVLGHRLSLLSVHAGALEYRPGAPPEDLARAAGVIRESAHQALQDLREVVGVLRAPVGELPQPTLADVRHLAAESGTAGMRVDLRQETEGTVPGAVGRTAYRVVQEALTNVRKHAPGAEVTVRLTGSPGRGLTVEVGNTPADTAPAALAGTPHGRAGAAPDGGGPGNGLMGLGERVGLAGGRLEHGPTAAGGWRVAAWLPWPS